MKKNNLSTSEYDRWGKNSLLTSGRVAVAVSGGVDSMVSAWLLKKSHPDLFGIHFTTGYERQPMNIAMNIEHLEKQLNIPVHRVDFRDVFEKHVVQYFIQTYCSGKTPNPCLICNQKVKFGALYDAAVHLGADTLATGHYAKIIRGETGGAAGAGNSLTGTPILLKGKDSVKDQSYFLSMLSCEQLRHAIFPLADFTKQEVIQLAREKGLVPSEKKESQDICFIHESSFADFIVSKTGMTFTPGDIVTPDNTVIGTHRGLHCYTIGQRRGLNCPGPAPYYVKKIDVKTNRLVVAFKEELFEQEMYVENLNWFCSDIECLKDPVTPALSPSTSTIATAPLTASTTSTATPATALVTASVNLTTKIRYSHSGAFSTLMPSPEFPGSDRVKIIFETPQLAVTPGQGAVFYDGDQVVGAGIIT